MAGRKLSPTASALIRSLRGIGYSLDTAVADLIDNSVAAGARNIRILPSFRDGKASIAILDDGRGMLEAELVEAMRFGGLGPAAARAEGDLGRFGLGLKTASISQARRLTVASSTGNSPLATWRWDLDHVENSASEWEILPGFDHASESPPDLPGPGKSGTLVLWENVDFGRTSEQVTEATLRGELRTLERHLGMVFHRFIERDALTIELGSLEIRPWDPFLEGHNPASQLVGKTRIPSPGGNVTVCGFVLPHRDRFRNEADFELAGGPDGWHAHQGFHVYRGDRLLVAGGWFRLGRGKGWTRSEGSRLARIRIEIPTSADFEWQIDVKKSVARPPASIRPKLEKLAEDVRQRAREVFLHRGGWKPPTHSSPIEPVWKTIEGAGTARYRINRDHPAILALKGSAGAERVNAALELVERMVPVERIWLDRSEDTEPLAPSKFVDPFIRQGATDLVNALVKSGRPLKEAIFAVVSAEPFDSIEGLRESLEAEFGRTR